MLRSAAASILRRWDSGGSFAESLIDQFCTQRKISSQDRALLSGIVLGTLRQRDWLDHVIFQFRKPPIDDDSLNLLEIGLCQLLILGISPHAAINETVEAAPKHSRGFINAILRSIQRNQEEILQQKQTLPFATRFSMPKWLIDRWISTFGGEKTRDFLTWFNEIPHLFLRKNPLIECDSIPENLIPISTEDNSLKNYFLCDGPLPLDLLKSGAFSVTDPSTRFAIEMLAPKQNESILDACAAPGGKSIAILNAADGKISLTASDLIDYRLPRLKENLTPFRANIQGEIGLQQVDWAKPCPKNFIGKFDAILLDVPCSNTGVMQRRVDVRWRLSANELSRLASLQSKILTNAIKALKPNGRLVYSTCSIDPLENSEQIKAFLAKNPDWQLADERLTLPGTKLIASDSEKWTNLGCDGSYSALLTKKQ